MRNRLKGLLSANSRRTVRLGRISLLLIVLAVAVLAQGCTQILDDDLGGGVDVGGGIVTPPVVPSGPMAANVRVVSDPQGGSYISELSCIIEASEIPGGGSNPIVITVNSVAPGVIETEIGDDFDVEMEDLIAHFRAQNPLVQVHCSVTSREKALTELLDGRMHLIVTSAREHSK